MTAYRTIPEDLLAETVRALEEFADPVPSHIVPRLQSLPIHENKPCGTCDGEREGWFRASHQSLSQKIPCPDCTGRASSPASAGEQSPAVQKAMGRFWAKLEQEDRTRPTPPVADDAVERLAMEAAVELEVNHAIGRVTTRAVGDVIAGAIRAALSTSKPAGIPAPANDGCGTVIITDDVAAQLRAAEAMRERCAQVADELTRIGEASAYAREIAKRIRALSTTEESR